MLGCKELHDPMEAQATPLMQTRPQSREWGYLAADLVVQRSSPNLVAYLTIDEEFWSSINVYGKRKAMVK